MRAAAAAAAATSCCCHSYHTAPDSLPPPSYTTNLYWAYTLFYVIGTAGAIQVPVVGWSPLKSLEQLGPCAVFLLIQAIELCQRLGHRLGHAGDAKKMWALRVKVFAVAGAGALLVIAMLWPTGYFGPFSSRIRSLFVKHTRTGNPLVDSVAEHQPASEEAYQHYLKDIYYIAPYGLLIALFCHWNDGSRFLVLYAVVAYVFSKKMMRLIILTGPIASALGGVALAGVFDWSVVQLQAEDPTAAAAAKRAKAKAEAEKAAQAVTDSLVEETVDVGKDGKKVSRSSACPPLHNNNKPAAPAHHGLPPSPQAAARAKAAAKNRRQNAKVQKKAADSMWTQLANGWDEVYNSQQVVHGRKAASVVLLAMLLWGVVGRGPDFYDYCHAMAKQMSHPSILFKATLRDGTPVVVDDYREAYWWLRDNTPPDARVMAWWDYGYQIAGIANRTTIADGNTWNHEHIATLGRCLTSPEKEAHRIIRHLADYVLIWTGGGGDDLAKSPHMARIGTSVYDDICPGDPTCRQFGMMQSGQPTPMMAASLLYKLHGHNQVPGIQADPNRFKEVYVTAPLLLLLLLLLPRPCYCCYHHPLHHHHHHHHHHHLLTISLTPAPSQVHVKVQQGADLRGPQGVQGLQEVGGRRGQPQVRRARVVVLRGDVPARPRQAHGEEEGLPAA